VLETAAPPWLEPKAFVGRFAARDVARGVVAPVGKATVSSGGAAVAGYQRMTGKPSSA